ncbi:SulP family inorganic anion transporter [Aridibaculum aurantiacum]|uniref:SulP family inorganic anion transporter n=1 Tax=Aridibaculum aurantiacum TaxID=2810307 RepID=UPI001A97B4DA|nr:solute carrier family 23 protein [Aridibaculum aurantiacum]
MKSVFKEIKSDLPASIVVFFVAVPLCLGIALASGAPLFAGIIAGIVGGIICGIASGSALGVSGPAAGLAVVVLNSIQTLGGSWHAFLLAVVLAGCLQLLAGYLRAGFVAYFFPSSVIKGMLTGIGLIIILKQIPHAVGYDENLEGSLQFAEPTGENTFSAIAHAFTQITPGAVLIALISIAILLLWENVLMKKSRIFHVIQGPLVAVVVGIIMFNLYRNGILNFTLADKQLVTLPVPENIGAFFGQFTSPDFSQLANPEVYFIAVVIAVIASLETLLCVEATDKLDPLKRVTPTNRELKAQGLGNIVSGLIGGLPITQVIVRSSANITFGAKTKLSAILHGVWLLLSVITIAHLLNMIPLATLAAILILVGYKLAKPALFIQMYKLGWEQFVPFMATVVGILATDLLKGIGIGLAVGIFYTLRHNYKNSHYVHDTKTVENGKEMHHLVLAEEVSFLNKANILKTLNAIPDNAKVVIDGSKSVAIDYDVIEIIQNFRQNAKSKNIEVELLGITEEKAEMSH